ncbi:MAG: permease-like cell division protein FtsX [Clostridia bacterium]|nr:permease-like cell division protein FtsX [Clostridia bacterium]
MKAQFRRLRTNLAYFFREGFKNIFVNGFMSFAAMSVLAACILITGSFTLVAYNIGVMIEDLESQNEIAVYIDDTVPREEAIKLEYQLKKIDNVDTIEFVPKEDAFEDYLEELGDDAYIIEDLREDNPLRDGYKITMKDISLHGETVKEISDIAGVGETISRKDISDKLLQIKNVVNAISMALIALLGAVSLFIVANTVRLALFYRREEIAIMKMVGATNSFIRMPFVVEGTIIGFLSGVVSYYAQYFVYKYITDKLIAGASFIEVVPFDAFSGTLFATVTFAGIVIGLIGSVFTIQKFMKV